MLFVFCVGLPVRLLGQRYWLLRLIPVATSAVPILAMVHFAQWRASPFVVFIGLMLAVELGPPQIYAMLRRRMIGSPTRSENG